MIDKKLIEKNITEILEKGIGLDLEDPNLQETPQRVARAFSEIFQGYSENLDKYLKFFPTKSEQMIIIEDIFCYSMCSHHILPFSCVISIGYIPKDKIIGISKIERIAKAICRKLQTQEQITEEIAEYLYQKLDAKGVGVVIHDSEHMCMKMRGVESKSAKVKTVVLKGCFNDEKIKDEFLKLI